VTEITTLQKYCGLTGQLYTVALLRYYENGTKRGFQNVKNFYLWVGRKGRGARLAATHPFPSPLRSGETAPE
jgi:hypothetical protein